MTLSSLPRIIELIPPRLPRLYNVGKRYGAHSMKQPEINALLVELASEGASKIVRLKGGDPFVFAHGGSKR